MKEFLAKDVKGREVFSWESPLSNSLPTQESRGESDRRRVVNHPRLGDGIGAAECDEVFGKIVEFSSG